MCTFSVILLYSYIQMISIQGLVRQNAWGNTPNSLQTVHDTGVLHCPWGHTHQDVQEYLSNPDLFSKKYAHIFTEFDVGTKILVAEAGSSEVLVVEIMGSTQTGRFPHYAIVRSERPCNHTFTKPGRGCHDGCGDCEDSVQQVVRTNIPLMECLQEGCVIEPFISIWRSVRVIGTIDISNPLHQDVRKYVAYQSSIKKTGIDIPESYVKYSM